jgi:hypothetical protein
MVAENPLYKVAEGAGKALETVSILKEVMVN